MRRGERPGRSINSIRHRQQRIVDETRPAPGLSDDGAGQTQHRGTSGHNSRCVAILKPQRRDSQHISYRPVLTADHPALANASHLRHVQTDSDRMMPEILLCAEQLKGRITEERFRASAAPPVAAHQRRHLDATTIGTAPMSGPPRKGTKHQRQHPHAGRIAAPMDGQTWAERQATTATWPIAGLSGRKYRKPKRSVRTMATTRTLIGGTCGRGRKTLARRDGQARASST